MASLTLKDFANVRLYEDINTYVFFISADSPKPELKTNFYKENQSPNQYETFQDCMIRKVALLRNSFAPLNLMISNTGVKNSLSGHSKKL